MDLPRPEDVLNATRGSGYFWPEGCDLWTAQEHLSLKNLPRSARPAPRRQPTAVFRVAIIQSGPLMKHEAHPAIQWTWSFQVIGGEDRYTSVGICG